MGTVQASTPSWCGHVFVLGQQAEIRHLILSVVCLDFTGMADQKNPFCLGGSLLFSGQGKWNRNVIWDINKWLGQPASLCFRPPFLAGPARSVCALAQLNARVPLSSSQATSNPTEPPLPVRPTLTSWVRKDEEIRLWRLEVWPEGRGRGFCPSALLRHHLEHCIELLVPWHAKTQTCWSGPRGGHKNDERAGTLLLWGKAERVGAVQPGEEKAPGRPYISLPVPEGTYKKAGERLFTRAWSGRTRSNGFKLKEGRFRLDIK